MANTDVINEIISVAGDAFTYLLPVVGIMAGIMFITTFLFAVTIGLAKRTFGR